MPGNIIIGLQWGDEGKGKIVDLFTAQSSHIVRSQGGNNAGHTIKTSTQELALHLIPSGILHPHAQCYIAGGCLVDPQLLIEEIRQLESQDIALESRLSISPYAHLIFPIHRTFDGLYEERKGEGLIGTTGRGIGPCMSDRTLRIGLRIAELIRPEIFRKRIEAFIQLKSSEWEQIFHQEPIDIENIFLEYLEYGKILRPFVRDVETRIRDALIRDETVLFEGAQGTLLDCIFGSYPYVTSSSTLAAGVCMGAGIGPTMIDRVHGVLKAYTTRVGKGPLPTQISDEELTKFSEIEDFREVGTTTGRARRIGWLDLVLARYAVRCNAVDSLILTKLDILDHFSEIKVCVGYEIDNEKIDRPPPLLEDLERVRPVYEIFPGWQTSTREVDKIRALPQNARHFIDAIEDFCCAPISMISVGPSRNQTIVIDEEWM